MTVTCPASSSTFTQPDLPEPDRLPDPGSPVGGPPEWSRPPCVGGSGYTGALLAELLLRHPAVTLDQISSETLAGEPVQQHLPRLRSGPRVLRARPTSAASTSPSSARRTARRRRVVKRCSTTASRSST